MPRVSQALIEFANTVRQPAAPGIEVVETPRYRIIIQPDFPIPGPNSAGWIRCSPEEADQVIDEVHATVAPRGLPIMWILDPSTRPADFHEYLAARGIEPDPHAPESAVMVLPIDAVIESHEVADLALTDALADPESFRRADAASAEAFMGVDVPNEPSVIARQERHRQNQVAQRNRRVLLALIDGEPAGSAGLTLFPPTGAILTGGGVRPKFRGRGIYRAMVAARLEMARQAGAAGLVVWGGPMSAPILEKLGFESVGWRRFYLDTSTAIAQDSDSIQAR